MLPHLIGFNLSIFNLFQNRSLIIPVCFLFNYFKRDVLKISQVQFRKKNWEVKACWNSDVICLVLNNQQQYVLWNKWMH